MAETTEYIEVRQVGPIEWQWEACGVLKRAKQFGSCVVMPGGGPRVLGSGRTFTAWGARRKAKRVLRWNV